LNSGIVHDQYDSTAQKRRKIRFSLSPRKICQIQIEEPTNNRAERALRFGMLWRKRSLGSQNNKGLRWVDRILTLKETCPIKAKAPFSSFGLDRLVLTYVPL
jgi:hypothetical protein